MASHGISHTVTIRFRVKPRLCPRDISLRLSPFFPYVIPSHYLRIRGRVLSAIELWMTSGVSSGSDPDISSRPLASSCLIHPLSFQTLSANLMTTFLLFKPSYHHRPDLIPTGAFALFKSWQGHDLCVTCCRAKKTTSKNQSSASQKRYSSIPLDHAP